MKEQTTAVGAVLAAIGVSACCTGPIVLAALGVGGVGFLVSLEKYRNFLIPITFLLLGSAHYFTWRKKEKKVSNDCCEVPKKDRLKKTILWIATGFAVFFLAFPYLLQVIR